MDETETLSETGELDSLEENSYNLPDVESESIAASEHEMVPQLVEGKETPETPNQTEHQLEQSTTRELVLQELAKSGRGEGMEVREGQGGFRLNEDGNELISVETGASYTKMIEESGDQEAIAIHYEMLQQWRDNGDAIFINSEKPGDEDPDTMHGSYMMQNPDGSISWGLTERRIERSEEGGATEREAGEASAENRWTTSEHTEHQMIQFDGHTDVLAQLAATQEADISRPDTVDVDSGEKDGEQAAAIDIETLASPAVDSAETITSEAVEIGNNVPAEVAEVVHGPSGAEVVSVSEFLHADPLESLPVFETQEAIVHVPEAVVLDVTSPPASQSLDIRETAMYQAIVAFLKNDTDAIHVSEKPDVEMATEPVQETADSGPISESREETVENIVMVPIENATTSTFSEAQSQPIETAQAAGSIETTTTQITSAEVPVAVSRVEEKIDIATILRHTDNQIRIAPEVAQEGRDEKIYEVESAGVRPEAPERQSVLNTHEILLKTLGIREKTVVIREERPYNNILRAGNPMIQLPSRTSTQPRGRTFTSKLGISLIEV